MFDQTTFDAKFDNISAVVQKESEKNQANKYFKTPSEVVNVRKVFVPTHAVVSTAKLSKSWDALNNTRSMKGAGLPSLPC
jgi:hypothetical protein